MTLSVLLYALMVCSCLALIGLLVVDGVRDRVGRLRPVAATISPCAPGRVRRGSAGGIRAARGHGARSLRRR